MHTIHVGAVKGRNVVSTIVRNTSCNNGWLRLVVHIIFATLIVSSFVLIMLMVVGQLGGRRSTSSSRCSITNCRVICINAPFYGDFEDDVINAASDADAHCESIVLKLVGPTFKNFRIPQSWLWSMTSNVRELIIVGGNVKQISSEAFMSPFGRNIKTLVLEEIEINSWETDMLVGLSNLQKLIVIDCLISDIQTGALAPVDDSLQFLEIKASNIWDPVNFTGTTRLLDLSVVNFSSNVFHKSLGNTSFIKLRACKVLYLNSCQIVSLEPGTFDYMENIDILYLNDNFLVTIPVGLFDRILPHQPRLALHDNVWHCDCSREDLRNIGREELFIVDPVCRSPVAVAGMTFSNFDAYCKSNDNANAEISHEHDILKTDSKVNESAIVIYMNGVCNGNTSSEDLKETLHVMPVSENYSCLLNRLTRKDIESFSYKTANGFSSTSGNWIKPTFFVDNNPYSVIKIISSALPGYGLLWYQSSCTSIVYCINTVPHILKVFNIDPSNYFTFCPFNLTTRTVADSYCLSYNLANMMPNNPYTVFRNNELVWFVCLSLGSLICGAICVYGVIQKNPTLLKGNKRVLLVKHRSVEALVLPPTLPIRNAERKQSKPSRQNIYEKKKIFILPHKLDPLTFQNYSRSVSLKSNGSNEASYILPLQPTEEQLTEWRSNQIVKQFDSTRCTDLSMVPYTSMYERESTPYYSFDSGERVYAVPEQR